MQVPTRDQVSKYLPDYDRGKLQLHPDNPITIAPQVNEDWLMEIRRQTDEAMRRAVGVIREAYDEFKEVFGRGDPSPFIDEYMCDDAEINPGRHGHIGDAGSGGRSPDAGRRQEGRLPED